MQISYLLLLAKEGASPKPAQTSTPRPRPGLLAPRASSNWGRFRGLASASSVHLYLYRLSL